LENAQSQSFEMTFSIYFSLLFVPAALAFAIPLAKPLVLGSPTNIFEKKFSKDAVLSGQRLHGQVLQFEAHQTIDDPNIPDLAKQLGLTSLVDLISSAGLVDVLSGAGPFTVFGPTNEAISNLPDWLKDLIANKTLLANILLFHVLPGNIPSSSLKDELLVDTALKGKQLRVNIYADAGVTVVTAQCSPIDLARVDNKAANGLIHVLNAVMIPPLGNIVESVSACPEFKTLVIAVTAANLVAALSGDGPFTLFAPTDKAFQKLPPDFLNYLLKNTTALKQVLEYHVVSLTYCSAGLVTGLYSQITTLTGQNITLTVGSEGLKVNNANVIVADGSVSNGVIHALDTVLIPPGLEVF
jgi:transforming growth factor-beta-induced protein